MNRDFFNYNTMLYIMILILGIPADIFTPADNLFETVEKIPENKCFCPGTEFCPPKGLQNISPCQYGTIFLLLNVLNNFQQCKTCIFINLRCSRIFIIPSFLRG